MSTICIAGGHGQVALHLTRLLADAGHDVRGLIRDPEQQPDIAEVGGTGVVCDLEHAGIEEVIAVLDGADSVVFAAGAGAGSGPARKETVDYGAAVKLVEACPRAGVGRYVMLSSMGTDDPPAGEEVFAVYLRAKARADEVVMASDLAWTIVRPGGLTDDEPTGKVQLDRHVPRGEIPRADVAAVLAEVVDNPTTVGHIVEVVGGDVDVATAITNLTS